MTALARVKFYLLSFLVAYVVYLFSYKCVQLRETPLEHAVGSAFHPLTHSHNIMCDSLYEGEAIILPYVNQAKALFHSKVVSHPSLKPWKIDSKYNAILKQYYTHAYPVVVEIFKVMEFYEKVAFDYAAQLYAYVSNMIHQKAKKL